MATTTRIVPLDNAAPEIGLLRPLACSVCLFEEGRPASLGDFPRPLGPGDFWLCSKCGMVHRLQLVAVPAEDTEFDALNVHDREELLAAREAIRRKVEGQG